MSFYYNTNAFKAGLKIIQDGEPCNIIENEFIKPGKGQAFNRVKLRKLISGKLVEKTFKSGENVEGADVTEKNLVCLYQDDETFYFMDPITFEQLSAPISAIGESRKWLIPQTECALTLWNQIPIAVTPPNFVYLKVTATDPGLKGDTAGTGGKPATLETGATVRVPLFIQPGEVIKVDTRSETYISRQK